MPLRVSSTCAYRQEGKLHYTVSGIITPIGGRPVHGLNMFRAPLCPSSGVQGCTLLHT
jgi:hypothetical protein